MDEKTNDSLSIEFISATRLSKEAFWKQSALGISLKRLSKAGRISAHIAFRNKQGLPVIYNSRIENRDGADVLVFIHDDVWIDDYFIVDRVLEGLKVYDVIGVAGNRRRVPNQPGWAFVDSNFSWDAKENLSGAVAHGKTPFGGVSFFGASPAKCMLIDGVFMAARRSTLAASEVLFDENFSFHFYDMDFCRSVEARGLSMGTWPISITHQSGGNFDQKQWQLAYAKYLKKWKS